MEVENGYKLSLVNFALSLVFEFCAKITWWISTQQMYATCVLAILDLSFGWGSLPLTSWMYIEGRTWAIPVDEDKCDELQQGIVGFPNNSQGNLQKKTGRRKKQQLWVPDCRLEQWYLLYFVGWVPTAIIVNVFDVSFERFRVLSAKIMANKIIL